LRFLNSFFPIAVFNLGAAKPVMGVARTPLAVLQSKKEKVMHARILRICTIVTTALLLVFLGAYAHAAEPETAKQVEKKELRISKDGKALVDQNGREVARFSKGIQMNKTEITAQKMQGCMCCTKECLIYDKNGVCIKTYSSCTWDFDCGCK
jgi:hypothetical protein